MNDEDLLRVQTSLAVLNDFAPFNRTANKWEEEVLPAVVGVEGVGVVLATAPPHKSFCISRAAITADVAPKSLLLRLESPPASRGRPGRFGFMPYNCFERWDPTKETHAEFSYRLIHTKTHFQNDFTRKWNS